MKVEVGCRNTGCATFGTVQLISVVAFDPMEGEAYDEGGNLIECEFCGAIFGPIQRLSSDSAQFAIGSVLVSDFIKMLLQGNDEDDPLAWAKEASQMVACHVSNLPSEGPANLFGDVAELEEGQIVTQHIFGGNPVWVVTNKERTETQVILASEYTPS